MDRLIERIRETNNPTVVGLDPTLAIIPECFSASFFAGVSEDQLLKAAADCMVAYNKEIIDVLCDIVPAAKPQAAYYECFGFEGVRALQETIKYAKQRGMYVITDGKRNDIGSTMEAYATAHLGETLVAGRKIPAFGADALTVNGYLGRDGIDPLLDVCEAYDRDLFVLVKTSNPSSGDLQDQRIDTTPVYEKMGALAEAWGADHRGPFGYSRVGAVVGATYPKQLRTLREQLPHTFFLVPGYGVQGGSGADIKGAFDAEGRGAIVNSSRGILAAYQKETGCSPADFASAARREALRMRDDITA